MDTTPQSTFPELELSQTGLNTLTSLDPLENTDLQNNNLGALNSEALLVESLDSISTTPEDPLIPSNNSQSTNISDSGDTDLTGNINTLVGEVTPDTRDSLFADNTGIFTVDDSGEISVDFLFDGGWFKGELAIFSLEGLEDIDPHSQEFKQTAANRALSNSDLGHILISDETEGARFDGSLGDGRFNSGDYAGVKTVEMAPGTEFGFLFVPHGNIEQVTENPRKRVLFSMTTPEASRSFNGQQFSDLTGDGHTFGIEDLSVEGNSDRDYNDIIFQLQGATGSVANLDTLIDPNKDWRTTNLGIAFQNYVMHDPNDVGSIELSDTVRYAFEGAANLDQYDPQALAETREWVIGISETQSADSVAFLLNAENQGETGIIDNTYVFKFSDEVTPQDVAEQLKDLSGVEFSYPLVRLPVSSSSIPNDPLFEDQWHLQNTGQTGGTIGADANIEQAWNLASGAGVVIGIIDDGLQHTHPDLTNQYRADLSWDFLDDDSDPLSNFDPHGTAVAGMAAANGNNLIGVTGSSPDSQIAGLRLFSDFLGTGVTDFDSAAALIHEIQEIDIYNNSWGLNPWNPVLTNPMPLTLAAIERGTHEGRGGLGSIYVWAAGNGLQSSDNVNYSSLINPRYSIAVSAIDHNGTQSWYSEPGSPILISAYSKGDGVGTVTTDLLGTDGYNGIDGNLDYTNDFGGTSSAAPLVSGVVALMLDANPNLTWRDVQHILVNTASHNDPTDTDWVTNGAGHLVNHKYGFGAVDATAAVTSAQSWTNVDPEISTTGSQTINQTIPDNNPTGLSSSVNITENIDIEWVEVVFDSDHTYRGDLEITLISPDGTESILAESRNDNGNDYQNWVFTSARHWGESSFGDWTLKVSDKAGEDIGTWNSWQLNIYGTELPEPLPIVEITTPDSLASEDGDTGEFVINRIGDLTDALNVNYSITGRADNGIDYEQLSGTATILSGDSSTTLSITPIDDALGEGDETVIISLDTSDSYEVGSETSGTVQILDNDPPPLIDLSGASFNVINEPVDAGDSLNINFTVQNTEPVAAESFDVDFYVSTNNFISTYDHYLGSYTIDGLTGNSSTDVLTISDLTLPSQGDAFWNSRGDGDYYIGMVIDSDNLVGEIDNSNNSSTGEFLDFDQVEINNTKFVDLTGTYFNVVQEPRDAGDRVDVSFEIENTEINSSGSFDVEFYISTNSTISTFDQYLGRYTVNNVLGNSDTGRLSTSLTLPSPGHSFWEDKCDGTYYIGMLVDANNDVNETNENNNNNQNEFDDYDGLQINNTHPLISAYSYNSNFTEFKGMISDRWGEGYDLVNVEYGGGRWFGVFGEDNGRSAYSTRNNLDAFSQEISNRWSQGYELIDVGYGNGTWFGVFNDGVMPGRNAWNYDSSLSSFTQSITERWNEGFTLTDVEYGNGTWFGVFHENNDANAYAYSGNLDSFTQQISDKWDEGYELIDVEYGNGTWFGVFGENTPGLNAYSYRSNITSFEQSIEDRWDQDYELVDTAYGNGTWFGVFQQEC